MIQKLLQLDTFIAKKKSLGHELKLISYYDDGTPDAHTVYSALCGKGAVCDGYSKAFFALCTMTGRRCLKVGTGEHSRNVVFVEGVPKWVDVTWNDLAGYNIVFLSDIDSAGMDYITKPGTEYSFKEEQKATDR